MSYNRAPSLASHQPSSPRNRRSLSGSIRRFSDLAAIHRRHSVSLTPRGPQPPRTELLLLRPPRGWRTVRADDIRTSSAALLKMTYHSLPPSSTTSSYSNSSISDPPTPSSNTTQPRAIRTGWVTVLGAILRKRMFLLLTNDGVLTVCSKQPSSATDALRIATWVLPMQATSMKTFPPPSCRINITLARGDLDNMPLDVRLNFGSYQETAEWKVLLSRATMTRPISVEPSLESKYILENTISDGAFSSVHIAMKRGSEKRVAIRFIHPPAQTEQVDRPETDRIDLSVLPRIRHPAILPITDVRRTPTNQLIAVIELMSNRFTLDNVLERDHVLPEPRVKEIARNVLSGLAHLHQMGLVHRAVNTSNIFCVPSEENHQALRSLPRQSKRRTLTSRKVRHTSPSSVVPDPLHVHSSTRRTSVEQTVRPGMVACLSEISLVNYASEPIAGRAFLTGLKERPHFAAPEAIRSLSYGSTIDIWGLGIAIFVALCGRYPFGQSACSYMEVLREIDSARPVSFTGHGRLWKLISSDCRDFIRQALTHDADNRPNAVDLLAHPWFSL